MTTSVDLSRMIKPRHLPAEPVTITASESERAALAARFGVTAIPSLEAVITLEPDGDAVTAKGTLTAQIEQPCALTGDDFTYPVEDQIDLRFLPTALAPAYAPDEEVELESDDLDIIEYDGDAFDLGEAVAQSLALAIDPYREGPNADEVRKAGLVSSEEASGPFAALAALKKD